MDQRHQPESNEPVSDDEVRALIERFGEKQAAPPGQPTVKDVAETLHVDSATVSEMLVEIRQSKDQNEIKQRLDRLEKENAELKSRAQNSPQIDLDQMNRQAGIWIALGIPILVVFTVIFLPRMRGMTPSLYIMIAIVGLIVLFGIIVAMAARRKP